MNATLGNLKEIKDFMELYNIKSFEELLLLDEMNIKDENIKATTEFIDKLDCLIEETNKSLPFAAIKNILSVYYTKINPADFE